jgi:hypothetical protein
VQTQEPLPATAFYNTKCYMYFLYGHFLYGTKFIRSLFIQSLFIRSFFIQFRIYTGQNLYISNFIRCKIYTVRNLYGHFLYRSKFIHIVQNLYSIKFKLEKKAIISSEFNGPILWTLYPVFGYFINPKCLRP